MPTYLCLMVWILEASLEEHMYTLNNSKTYYLTHFFKNVMQNHEKSRVCQIKNEKHVKKN